MRTFKVKSQRYTRGNFMSAFTNESSSHYRCAEATENSICPDKTPEGFPDAKQQEILPVRLGFGRADAELE